MSLTSAWNWLINDYPIILFFVGIALVVGIMKLTKYLKNKKMKKKKQTPENPLGLDDFTLNDNDIIKRSANVMDEFKIRADSLNKEISNTRQKMISELNEVRKFKADIKTMVNVLKSLSVETTNDSTVSPKPLH